MVCMNLLVINQYVYQFERFGAGDSFTDAIYPLSESLDEDRGDTVYVADWGIFDSLNLLHQGRLKLRVGSGPVETGIPSEDQRDDLDFMLQDPTGLWVGHVTEKEVSAGIGARLDEAAAEVGLERQDLRVVTDSNGRPMFEVFRFGRRQ